MAGCTLLTAAILLCTLELARGAALCTNASQQLELMLAEYERAEPPPGALRVHAALDVQHAAVDDAAAAVRLLAALHLSWEDKRLAWNASEWGCHAAMAAAERLWLPDVGALNAVSAGSAAGVGLRARLASDGRVAWVLRYDLRAPLSLQLWAWPRDEQHATFRFGSRHHAGLFNLTVDDFTHATVFEAGTWELLRVSGGTSARRGGTAEWRVALRRRAAAHLLAARSVLAAAALLLLAAALQPPDTRAATAAASALTAAIWLCASLSRLASAGAAPALLQLAGALCACAALACVGAAAVRRVAAVRAPPPAALRRLVTAASALCTLQPPEGAAAEWSAWAAGAQLLDRALLAAVVLAVCALLCFALAI